jgi:signal transduction histidine kinase/CheY-like chemotaxis protein
MTRLYVMNGPDRGDSFDLKGKIIYVGRGPDNDIQIKEKSVSRKHLRIQKKGEEGPFIIKDLNSTNGTFIQGKKTDPAKEYEVKEGLPIVIGNIIISFGKPCVEDVQAIQETIDPVSELSETGIFDRPMTSPKNLELIYNVSNALMESLDLNGLLEKILQYIFDLLKRIDRGAIILVEPGTGKVSEVITRSSDKGQKTTRLYSRSIVTKVIQEGKAIVVTDTFGQDKVNRSESMELMKIRSVMCVPLISRARVRGVIYVDSLNRPSGFRKEDLSLLTALSSPAAVAIENALLYANLENIVAERTRSLSETEERLRESEARYRAIFDNMSSGVVVYEAVNNGEDFVVLDVNRADRKIEKVLKRDALGKSVIDIFPEVKESGLLEAFKRVWDTGKPERRSVTIKEGEKIREWREYYVYRLPTGEIVTIFDDMTEKKKAETEQKTLQRQLFVSQRMESIGAFAGGTAHNFRNILQAISGNIEYLEMIQVESPGVKELAKSIYDSVEKGVDLINNLLHFARRGEGYRLVDLDLADVIKKAYEIIEKVLNKNIDIKLKLDNDLFINGNHSLLSQVFMNLFTNARDAMPEGGRLLIEAKRQKDKVVATVADTGHGMDKETLEKIFDPFFTLKDVGKGTGLGLSTTHGIVEKHKGAISVRSTPGKGTVFTVSFPLVDGKAIEATESRRKILIGKGQKVLIVDDEPPVLEALTNLTNSLGYQAIAVDRSRKAVENYGKWGPDVVLMDRNMPEMDGITCIKEILKKDPGARIVIVSGYNDSGPNGIDEDARRLIKGYLVKPCGLEALSQALFEALES